MTPELKLYDVVDRGLPNKERIPIHVLSDYYMQNIWIGLGLRHSPGQLMPINDNSLWLGTGWVKKGDWIFIYTGKGEPQTNQIPNQDNKTYTYHWNRSSVLFSSPELHPYLLEGSISLPPELTMQNLLNALEGYVPQTED